MHTIAEVRVVDVLTRIQRQWWRELSERLAEEGVGVEQWRVLRALGAADGLSMGELAEQVQVPAPSLTRLVDGLVDQAQVHRRQSAQDRRRIDVHLSAGGQVLLSLLEAIATAHEQAIEQTLQGGTLPALRHMLNELERSCPTALATDPAP